MKTITRFGISALAIVLSVMSVPMTPVIVYAASDKSQASKSNAHANEHRELPAQANASERSAQHQEETIVAATPATEAKISQPATTAPTLTAASVQSPSYKDPAGNNGTVKIDRTPFDNHPDNQLHVTCSFQVDFYGFDAGVGNAEVIFELQSPTRNGRTLAVTSGDLSPNIGEDAASGGTDLDASETYTLAFTGAPHSKQGYHVKLTTHAPGSQGNDVKHKVFWVQPCLTPSQTTPPSTPGVISGEAVSIATARVLASNTELPASLPHTGGTSLTTLIGLMLAFGTYITAYRINTKKKLFS